MAQLGQFALALAWVVTAYSIVASLLGIRLKHDNLIASGRNAAIGTFACITTAMVCLGYLFAVSDFSIKYIAAHSNRDLPMYFKVSSIWGGQEGSLLFWGWLLTLYSALVIIQNWRKHSAMMPYVVAVLMATSFFFTSMHLFIVNPFNQTVFLQAGASPLPFVPHDGQGLNPLLQDAYMVIHPPMLYLGFVGFAVPFAFAMAAMITKQLGDTWIRTTRRWTMVAWMFLSIGILLGGKWAYHELGWGGFWAWDPVENASMMPWLIGTAFLHSVMVQEKKGMLKVWNMVLIILTFIMSVFGTLLTRSGMVQSVHAFAQSPVGGYFRAFIIVALSGALYLLFDRLPYLKSENQMESIVSRESSFMFNNLILLAACFAVFWGTMFPIISEAATGSKITVGPPFFNKVNVPIAIFLMLLTGVGPLLAWRRASTNSLKRNFLLRVAIDRDVGLRDCHDRSRILQGRLGSKFRNRRNVSGSGRQSHTPEHAAVRRIHCALRFRPPVYRLVGSGLHDGCGRRDGDRRHVTDPRIHIACRQTRNRRHPQLRLRQSDSQSLRVRQESREPLSRKAALQGRTGTATDHRSLDLFHRQE